MNKLTKAIILGSVALATIISTFQTADAGDRLWRNRGFNDRGWHGHHGPGPGRWVAAGVLGLAAGVIVSDALSEPRVVYRERPVYVDPDNGPDEYLGPVDGVMDPDDGDYVLPRNQHRVERIERDDQYQGDPNQMDRQAQDDDYFPDKPQKYRNSRNRDVAQQGALEPWTAKWRTYCKQRYSSFNATTGTYQGYDGKNHFCTSG